jgi:hypothetical protein
MSMAEERLPFALYPDERALRQTRAVHLRSTPARIGFNPLNGDLWLTTQRILFQPDQGASITGNAVAYPLGHITATSVVAVRVDIARYTPLRLDFDDGGQEYFEFKGRATRPRTGRRLSTRRARVRWRRPTRHKRPRRPVSRGPADGPGASSAWSSAASSSR